jgi:hypothetical protein
MAVDSRNHCSSCGAALTQPADRCPYCQQPLWPLFANPDLLRLTEQFLLEQDDKLNEIPALTGWGMLLLWFGVPLLAPLILIIVLPYTMLLRWILGIAAALLVFGVLTIPMAYLRDKIFTKNYQKVIQPAVVRFLQYHSIQKEELLLFTQQHPKLQKGKLWHYFQHEY